MRIQIVLFYGVINVLFTYRGLYLALSIFNVVCKKRPRETSSSSDDRDGISGDQYWDTSSSGDEPSREKDRGGGGGLSIDGKLRRQLAYSLFLANPSDSAVCSPISALMPLGKLALGASGTTRKELLAAIGAKKISEMKSKMKKMISNLRNPTGVRISICSGLYVDEKDSLHPKFKKQVEKTFGSNVQRVNFKHPDDAARRINDWVSQHTNHKIKNILKATDITPDASIILVNAIYFSGDWKHQFRRAKSAPFYGARGEQTVSMMTREEKYKYYESSSLGAQIIEIPYKGSNAAMIVVLPKSKSSSSLSLLLKQLKVAPNLLKDALKKLRYDTVLLSIPKFKIETRFDLSVQYRNIGLSAMFHKKIDKMIANKEMFVSKAVQSATIEVDECGTTATASTIVEAVFISAVVGPKTKMTADHPFLFTIIAKNQQLFTGILTGAANGYVI